MNKLVSLATVGAALAIGLGAAGSAGAAAVEVQRLETAANLAMIKTDLAAVANVTFSSDLPGAPEADDSLSAFNMVAKGEAGDVSDPNFDVGSARLVNIVFYYEKMTPDGKFNNKDLSDSVGRFVDKNGRESFSFSSDTCEKPGGAGAVFCTVPEPATWAMMLAGLGLVGMALRRPRNARGTLHA